MKPQVAAAVGIRLISLTAILYGLICIFALLLPTTHWVLAPVPNSPQIYEHDTFYITYRPHFVFGNVTIIVGIILFMASRPLGRFIAKGLVDSTQD